MHGRLCACTSIVWPAFREKCVYPGFYTPGACVVSSSLEAHTREGAYPGSTLAWVLGCPNVYPID